MNASDNTLHPQLAADCHQLGRMETCQLLLMDNRLVPWFILVPDTDKKELFQLDAEMQYLIQQETNALSAFLLDQPGIEKINIGALGNLVPQLHIHVIGRHPGDYCWPAPVWGQAGRESYTHEEVPQLTSRLSDFMCAQQVNFSAN